MSVTIVNPVHPTPQAEQAWDRALDEALARPRGRSVAQPVVKIVAKFAPRFASVLAALLLSACAAPAFHQPAVSTPAAFKESQTAAPSASPDAVRSAADGSTWKLAQPAESQPRGEWWKAFNDARLDSLIAQATASNQNLSVAAARVKQARAIAGIAEADRIPAGRRRRGRPAWPPVAAGSERGAGHRRRTGDQLQGESERQLRGRPVRPRIQQRGGGARRCRSQRGDLPLGAAVAAGRRRPDLFQAAFPGRRTGDREPDRAPARGERARDRPPLRAGRHRRIRPVAGQDGAGDRARRGDRPAAPARHLRACARGAAGPAGLELRCGERSAGSERQPAADSGRPALKPAGAPARHRQRPAYDGSGQRPHRRGAGPPCSRR
jgi:hypothetical protein